MATRLHLPHFKRGITSRVAGTSQDGFSSSSSLLSFSMIVSRGTYLTLPDYYP